MSMGIRHERPGVYSSYETSGLTAANAGGGKVAVIAEAGEAEPGKVFQWTSYSRAAADVGECALSRLARIALRNGAGTVYGAAAGTDWDEAVGAVGGGGEAVLVPGAEAVQDLRELRYSRRRSTDPMAFVNDDAVPDVAVEVQVKTA